MILTGTFLRRRTRRKILFTAASILTLAAVAGASGIVTYSYVGAKNAASAAYYESELQMLERTVFRAASDINAGEIITADRIAEDRAYSSEPVENFFDLSDVGKTAVCEIRAGHCIQKGMISDGISGDGIRETECRTIHLSDNISSGNVVDIRMYKPDGTDCVVVSKKTITLPAFETEEDRYYSENNLCYLKLSEEEIRTLSAAIAESSLFEEAYLYTTRYVNPDAEEASPVTYTYRINSEIISNNGDYNYSANTAAPDNSDYNYSANTVVPEEDGIWTP